MLTCLLCDPGALKHDTATSLSATPVDMYFVEPISPEMTGIVPASTPPAASGYKGSYHDANFSFSFNLGALHACWCKTRFAYCSIVVFVTCKFCMSPYT